MARILKGFGFGVLGGVLADGLTLLLALGYPGLDPVSGNVIFRLLLVGSILGFTAGAAWGSKVVKWLLDALMNL